MLVVVLTPALVQERLAGLEEFVEADYKPTHPRKVRDWVAYEREWATRLVGAARRLEPLVARACVIHEERGRGAPHKLQLPHRVLILLLKTLFHKSNRMMAALLVLFGLLSGIDVSYKTVERLYANPGVDVALANLHRLMLEERGVRWTHASGDGTGYGLSITRHYASTVQRLRDKAKANPASPLVGPALPAAAKPPKKVKRWVYAFRLLDLRTRLYVATGTSLRSEREAYDAALAWLDRVGVSVASIRLDRYYSRPKDSANFPEAAFYVLPRKDLAHLPIQKEWLAAMRSFVDDTIHYLEQYYQREASEAAFGADKRALGWTLAQRRSDRLATAGVAHMTWHNLLNLHGPDHAIPAGASL
jgi:transposase